LDAPGAPGTEPRHRRRLQFVAHKRLSLRGVRQESLGGERRHRRSTKEFQYSARTRGQRQSDGSQRNRSLDLVEALEHHLSVPHRDLQAPAGHQHSLERDASGKRRQQQPLASQRHGVVGLQRTPLGRY
jgi:hypothetical protein